jgi:hypothetical protein
MLARLWRAGIIAVTDVAAAKRLADAHATVVSGWHLTSQVRIKGRTGRARHVEVAAAEMGLPGWVQAVAR